MHINKKWKEWISIRIAKQPGQMVLLAILLFNVFFFLLSALIISRFALTGTDNMSFIQAAITTITMILDAGCIQFVISDIGAADVGVALMCLVVIIIGMISFTGAVIGYVTNYISGFIDAAGNGSRKLFMENHTVILNWNSRASEIINDLLYTGDKENVVVLVAGRKDEIEKEISERLQDSVARENQALREQLQGLNWFDRWLEYRRNMFRSNVTVIVREGDVFSSKQLNDISLENARSVVILGSDINNNACRVELQFQMEQHERGNAQTIKTLMQVADITASETSADKQKIIVEISDPWTEDVVDKIIQYKQVDAKCNIVPLPVNKILGQILSQFCIMPKLNAAYRELFSNKGATFFSEEHERPEDEEIYVLEYLANHNRAIPLTFMDTKGGTHCYYAAERELDIHRPDKTSSSNYTVSINHDYWMERKNVIILGHNSKIADIMNGFEAFRSEWNFPDGSEILHIQVIDDEKSLEKMDYYRAYPFVEKIVPASIYDRELICRTIEEFVDANQEDTSILILSDDTALNENIDANALANLVYVQDIINRKKRENPDFDENSMDVIVEIIDPKHHDIVSSYSVNNVVISNRYISKMITQIGEKEAVYDFYTDILTYDTEEEAKEMVYESKEIYVKKVSRFFKETPGRCTAEEFIRAVYQASIDPLLPREKHNPTIPLGYITGPNEEMVLFHGDHSKQIVELLDTDKIIVFSNH